MGCVRRGEDGRVTDGRPDRGWKARGGVRARRHGTGCRRPAGEGCELPRDRRRDRLRKGTSMLRENTGPVCTVLYCSHVNHDVRTQPPIGVALVTHFTSVRTCSGQTKNFSRVEWKNDIHCRGNPAHGITSYPQSPTRPNGVTCYPFTNGVHSTEDSRGHTKLDTTRQTTYRRFLGSEYEGPPTLYSAASGRF